MDQINGKKLFIYHINLNYVLYSDIFERTSSNINFIRLISTFKG